MSHCAAEVSKLASPEKRNTRMTFPSLLICLIVFFSFLPKNNSMSVGSGNFNIGVIDILAFICLLILIQEGGRNLRSIAPELKLIFSYFVVAIVSVSFSASPIDTFKSILKIVEAFVIFLFAYSYSVKTLPFILAAISGAVVSIFMIDAFSGDSKIYSAGFFLASFFFLVCAIIDDRFSKKTKFIFQVTSILFFLLAVIFFPKKGAVIAFFIAFGYLLVARSLRVDRLKWFILILVALIPILQIASWVNPGVSSQLSEISLFASGEKVEDASNMYMRVLLVISTPFVMLNSEYLGFGASVTVGGLGHGLFSLMTSLSTYVFDFVPTDRILHPGSNAFSDNLYFTLAAELGFFVLLPACFLILLLKKRISSPVVFSYCLFILIFSFSSIDIGIYRGFQITFLNAILYGLLLNAGLRRRSFQLIIERGLG